MTVYSIEELQIYAERTGIHRCPDLTALQQNRLIRNVPTLEVGCGFGRVLSYLHHNALVDSRKHTAVDVSRPFMNYYARELLQMYPCTPQRTQSQQIVTPTLPYSCGSTLIPSRIEDYLSTHFHARYSQILWLWTGISEYSFDNQLTTLKQLFSHVSPSGYLAVDILLDTPQQTHQCNQLTSFVDGSYQLTAQLSRGRTQSCDMPSVLRMIDYGKHLQAGQWQFVHYNTINCAEIRQDRCIVIYHKDKETQHRGTYPPLDELRSSESESEEASFDLVGSYLQY